MIAAMTEPAESSAPPETRAEALRRIAAERLEAERQITRFYRREMVFTALACVFWCALGLAFMFAGFAVRGVQKGWALVWSGLIVGYGGITWTLVRAYLRGEARGDW